MDAERKKQLKEMGVEIRKPTKEEKDESREYGKAQAVGRKMFVIKCPWK